MDLNKANIFILFLEESG